MLCLGCPSSVRVSPSSGPFIAGDTLTCMSDSYPEPSYTWTANDGVVISTGPSIMLTGNHSNLTCTATGNFTAPCTASETITVGTWNTHQSCIIVIIVILISSK